MLRLSAIAVGFAVLFSPSLAQAEWVTLGARPLPHLFKKGSIPVGNKLGFIDKLKIKVEGCDLQIDWLKVVFGNTESFDINLAERLGAGKETRAIDLPGTARYIVRIEFGYKSFGKPGSPKPKITISGRRPGKAKLDLRAAAFVTIGEAEAGFAAESCSLLPYPDAGPYRKIKFRVLHRKVRIKELKVHFANGETYDVVVRKDFDPDTETRVLELPGKARVIQRVDLGFKTRGAPSGPKGLIQLLGRKLAKQVEDPKPEIFAAWNRHGSTFVTSKARRASIPLAEGSQAKKLRIKVLKKGLFISSFKLVFDDGSTYELQINRLVVKNLCSPVYKVPGGPRTIKQVDVVYLRDGTGASELIVEGR